MTVTSGDISMSASRPKMIDATATTSWTMKKIRTKLSPPVYYKKPWGNPRGGGQKIWRATTNTTSQEAEYGTIFGEMDRNMEKNMEANMEVSLLRLWALILPFFGPVRERPGQLAAARANWPVSWPRENAELAELN